jgi:hypothetical protein
MEPSGYVAWDDISRPDSTGKQARETVPQAVVGHALKSHYFKTIYEDRTVASLREASHDYAMGETPANFNFNILVLLAGLTWIAAFGRSKQGLTREVVGVSVSFAVDEFVEGNWIGSPYLERVTEKLNADVSDYLAHAFRQLEKPWFEVNREGVVGKAAEKLAIFPLSPMRSDLEKLVTEQLAALEDLLDLYNVR